MLQKKTKTPCAHRRGAADVAVTDSLQLTVTHCGCWCWEPKKEGPKKNPQRATTTCPPPRRTHARSRVAQSHPHKLTPPPLWQVYGEQSFASSTSILGCTASFFFHLPSLRRSTLSLSAHLHLDYLFPVFFASPRWCFALGAHVLHTLKVAELDFISVIQPPPEPEGRAGRPFALDSRGHGLSTH